jgi:hypothetical protein
MLEKVKEFHEKLLKFSENEDIRSRLQDVVEGALREAYYELGTAKDPKYVLEDSICSKMVDKMVFNKASFEEGREVAEKVAEEIIKLTGGDFNNLKKFGELYIKLNRVKKLEKELSKADLDIKRQSKFSSRERKG